MPEGFCSTGSRVQPRLLRAAGPNSCEELSVKINCEGCFKATVKEAHCCVHL